MNEVKVADLIREATASESACRAMYNVMRRRGEVSPTEGENHTHLVTAAEAEKLREAFARVGKGKAASGTPPPAPEPPTPASAEPEKPIDSAAALATTPGPEKTTPPKGDPKPVSRSDEEPGDGEEPKKSGKAWLWLLGAGAAVGAIALLVSMGRRRREDRKSLSRVPIEPAEVAAPVLSPFEPSYLAAYSRRVGEAARRG